MRITLSDGRTINIPNNPLKAYLLGSRHGAQKTMDFVAMALLDKCGYHAREEYPGDKMSVEYVYHRTEDTADSINKGYLKHRDIKEILRDEAGIRFVDDEVT